MKILILNWRDIKNPSSGGAEILTHEMAARWVRLGHEVVFFTSSFQNCLEEEIVDGIRIIRRGNPDIRSLFKSVHFSAFYHYLRYFKNNIDIVVDEIHGMPFFTPFYVKERKIVLICEVAGDLWKKTFGYVLGSIGRFVEIMCLRYIYNDTPYLTISDSTRQDLILNSVPSKDIKVITMGINVPKDLRPKKKESDPTLIFVGRITQSKGIEDAIEVFIKINKKYPKTKLWIVGRGNEKYEKYLNKLSLKYQARKKITFHGFVSERKKFELLSRAWILIHPSKGEGWGINVIEANAVGTPAIGYNISGLRDSIRNLRTGILVDNSRSVDGLFDAIIKLINNKDLYMELSKNAKVWSKNFSWDKAGSESLKIIESIYDKKKQFTKH